MVLVVLRDHNVKIIISIISIFKAALTGVIVAVVNL